MNSVTLFSDITTEMALGNIESEAKKHDGLYVDMTDNKQRKYVKGKAVAINDLLKKLDRARIDKARDYKVSIEAEALEIKSRLEAANEPFTLLINSYNEERAKVLAEEKRIEEERLAVIQFEKDYKGGVQLNRLFDLEVKEAILVKRAEAQAQIDHDKKIAEDAASQAREDAAKLIIQQKEESEAREAAAKASEERAKQAIIDGEANTAIRFKQQAEQAEVDKKLAVAEEVQRQEIEKQKESDAQTKRENDKNHRRKINNIAKQCFIDGGLSEECAKQAVTLLAKGVIDNAVINY